MGCCYHIKRVDVDMKSVVFAELPANVTYMPPLIICSSEGQSTNGLFDYLKARLPDRYFVFDIPQLMAKPKP
jgi:hypothetical protein